MKDKPMHQCDCGETMVMVASGDNLVANYACPRCSPRCSPGVDGGDIILTPGLGGCGCGGAPDGRHGAVIFRTADHREFLRLENSGDAFVLGEKVATRKDVFDAFVQWLGDAMAPRHAFLTTEPKP